MTRTKETYLAIRKKAVTALEALDEARVRPLSRNPHKAQQQWSEVKRLLNVVRDLGKEVASASNLAQEARSAYKAEICSSNSNVSFPNTPLHAKITSATYCAKIALYILILAIITTTILATTTTIVTTATATVTSVPTAI